MFRSRLVSSRRFALLVALVASAGLLTASSAQGVTASATPGSQAVCSGCFASWGLSWGDVPNYNVSFSYGDGTPEWSKTNISYMSKGLSHQFYTCIGQTYQQHLHVQDHTGATADVYPYTDVAKGDFCAPTN